MTKLKLYNPITDIKKDMPIDNIGFLLKKTLPISILRKIILTKYFSKFSGFILNNSFLSFLLVYFKLAEKINLKITKTFKKQKHKNLNQSFKYRYNRILYPENSKIIEIFSSPVDAYFNMRKIENLKIKLFPELILDIKKMINPENAKLFKNGGKFLLFTLKPFHDHTVDYPTNSRVITTPLEINKKRKIINPTDLYYALFSSKNYKKTIFDENHRVITKLYSTAFNEEYFILEVGAVNVNSIKQDNCKKNKEYKRGVQKSHFNFGSTVIILLPDSFSKKINFLKVFNQDENTSVEIKRGCILATKKITVKEKITYITNILKIL